MDMRNLKKEIAFNVRGKKESGNKRGSYAEA